MNFDEIIIKYVEGGLVKNLEWLIQNLQSDPEVIASVSREKENLLKLLNTVNDEIQDFIGDGDDNRGQQDDKELFGDDDIAVGGPGGTATDFMDPPDSDTDNPFPHGDTEDEDTDSPPDDFDDGFPK